MEQYFVMLQHPDGSILPLLDEDGADVVIFNTFKDADMAGSANFFGEAFGYEVFCRGNGE